jgi:hypothetical protein
MSLRVTQSARALVFREGTGSRTCRCEEEKTDALSVFSDVQTPIVCAIPPRHPCQFLRRKGKRQALGRFPRRSNLPQGPVDRVIEIYLHDNCTRLCPPFNPIPAALQRQDSVDSSVQFVPRCSLALESIAALPWAVPTKQSRLNISQVYCRESTRFQQNPLCFPR